MPKPKMFKKSGCVCECLVEIINDRDCQNFFSMPIKYFITEDFLFDEEKTNQHFSSLFKKRIVNFNDYNWLWFKRDGGLFPGLHWIKLDEETFNRVKAYELRKEKMKRIC